MFISAQHRPNSPVSALHAATYAHNLGPTLADKTCCEAATKGLQVGLIWAWLQLGSNMVHGVFGGSLGPTVGKHGPILPTQRAMLKTSVFNYYYFQCFWASMGCGLGGIFRTLCRCWAQLGGQLPHTYLLDPTSAFTPHPHLPLLNFKKPSLTRTISLLIRVGVVLIAKRLLEQLW